MMGRRIGFFLLKWGSIAAFWGLMAIGAVIFYYSLFLPRTDDLLDDSRRPGITLLAVDGQVFANAGDFYGLPRAVRDLPPHVPQAVLAIEDRRFYSHFGLDLIGLARALFVNLTEGRPVQGGSTITQQVAKNVFLTPEKSLSRKIQEAILAVWLERKFTKDEILGIYLNRVYLGAGTYGIDAAAQRYFGKPAPQLTIYESAVIAGLLRAPARLNPVRSPDAAALRTRTVLKAMVDAGFITADQADLAAGEEARLNRIAEARPGRYFADWIMEQLPALVSPDQDLVVLTTLDLARQRRSEQQVAALLDAEGIRRKAGEAAAVTLDTSGAVLSMVGGRSYARSQFNRALALRQPGSAFKPLVFLTALERGWTADSLLLDAPLRIGKWTPDNYDGRTRGEVTLTTALAESLNIPTVRLAQSVGIKSVIATGRRLGLSAPLPANLATSLGAGEVSLLELTGVYAAIASGGRPVEAHGIREIRDRMGRTLWKRQPEENIQGVDAGAVAALDGMLREVVRRGTGKAAQPAGQPPVAGKTGTTSDYRDAWFVGYSGRRVTGVWIGNDNASPTDKVTGGDMPARLWNSLMSEVPPP